MPNIEIHGMGRSRTLVTDKINVLKERIWECFLERPYINDVVVTVVDDRPQDPMGRSCPFLRLVSTREEYIPDVVERLKTLNMDIEHVDLAAFYEAPK